jgi:hypothetical protein
MLLLRPQYSCMKYSAKETYPEVQENEDPIDYLLPKSRLAS